MEDHGRIIQARSHGRLRQELENRLCEGAASYLSVCVRADLGAHRRSACVESGKQRWR